MISQVTWQQQGQRYFPIKVTFAGNPEDSKASPLLVQQYHRHINGNTVNFTRDHSKPQEQTENKRALSLYSQRRYNNV